VSEVFFMLEDYQYSYAERIARDMKEFQPWSGNVKWQSLLPLQAKTYPVRNLFPEVLPHVMCPHKDVPVECRAVSPKKTFTYRNVILPARRPLVIGKKNGDWDLKKGYAFFDEPVAIPSLYQEGRGTVNPWMSLTVNEVLTLRPGTRRAKGHVIVGGLGLGHQLIEVSKRKQVTSLTLIEISKELVGWLMPRIESHLGCKVKVVVGDVYKELPKMMADIVLLDVFASYGWNGDSWKVKEVMEKSHGIKDWWIWG
jgi:hypothetical protein